jgi:predicted DNA-binding mobile mystery protein A
MSLAMSQADLGRRMGVTRQAIGQLERRESDGSATIKALEEAARALGGEFVYAIVPHRPLGRTLEERADRLARQMTASVRHTMRLEDQETDTDLEARTAEITAELLASPRRLWSLPDGE